VATGRSKGSAQLLLKLCGTFLVIKSSLGRAWQQRPNGQTEKPQSLRSSSALPLLICGGEAYLMRYDGNRAAEEFQKFIDHRGLVMSLFWGALARLGLARAYALQGDTGKARAA